MKKTPNIGLTEIGTSYADKDMDLMEWRTLVAGEDSSNMSIIDKEVGDLKKVIKKDGTGQKYLSDDGTYRYVSGSGGTSKLAFASDNYLVYTATTSTTTFTIAGMSTSKSVELIKDNMVMMQGQEYEIDKSTGIVTLLFTLNKGEKIYYSVVEGEEKAILYSDSATVEGNREKSLTDINGNFIAPKTTITAIEGLSGSISTINEQINVLNREEIIPITYLNGFKQIWGGQSCVRKGNEVTLYLEINKQNVSDISKPIMMVKYKPINAIITMGYSDNFSASNISLGTDGIVSVHTWSHGGIGTNTIVTIQYVTREAFR